MTLAARLGVVPLALLLVFASGCGLKARNKIVPVEGKITFADGAPLPEGTQLVFNPGEGGMGTASGVTSSDGTFRLKHVSGATGAEVGKYVVVLRAPADNPGNFYKIVPKDYYDAGALSAEVTEGMQPLGFKVPRARGK
jgi:hypothetical protein